MTDPTIIAVGELLVEFVSHRRGCALRELADYSGPYPSGAPAICIDQAARMQARSQIFGGLGNDNFGAALIDRLRSTGVATEGILRLADKTTGVAFVSYFDDGSRTFIFHLADTAADAIADARFELPAGPLLLHVSGSSLGNPRLRAAVEKTVAETLGRGGRISCDPNARAELTGDPRARAALDAVMRKSAYLFPSTSDLEFLFPGDAENQAVDRLRSYGAEIVALKRGAGGCTVYSENDSVTLPSHNVEEVDPTGAGDCFCGTFLALIAQGRSPETAGRYANAAGALAVMRRGPMEGNSDRETIERFLASRAGTTNVGVD